MGRQRVQGLVYSRLLILFGNIWMKDIFPEKYLPTSSSSSAPSRDLLGEPDPDGELDVDFLDKRRSLKSFGEHLNKV